MTAVTNYPRITLSSGLVGVVVDTSIDYTFKGRCMCEAMHHLLASAVAAMLRDPDDTSRCLLDYEAASRLTDEDYEAFWKALGYTLAYYDDCKVKIEGEISLPAGLKLPGVYRCLHQSNQSGGAPAGYGGRRDVYSTFRRSGLLGSR